MLMLGKVDKQWECGEPVTRACMTCMRGENEGLRTRGGEGQTPVTTACSQKLAERENYRQREWSWKMKAITPTEK